MDIAKLGLDIDARPAAQGATELDKLTAAAGRAEAGTRKLTATQQAFGSATTAASSPLREMAEAIARVEAEERAAYNATRVMTDAVNNQRAAMGQAGAAAQQLNAHVQAYQQSLSRGTAVMGQADAHMAAYRKNVAQVGKGLRLTAHEGLNLSRQMADVGVTLAMGMNPFMIAMQQGPQIFDVMQTAAVRSGGTIRAVMVATGAAVWRALAPLLPVILAIAAAAGTLAIGWGLATRAVTKDLGDLTVGMGLNEAQLKRLEDANIQTTATAGDAWRGLGTTIGDMFGNVFGDQLAWVDRQWNAFLDDLTANTGKEVDAILGFFVGAYRAVTGTWSQLPSAIGDAAITAARAVVGAVEDIINAGIDGINRLNAGLRGLARTNPLQFSLLALLPDLGRVSLDRPGNPYAGGAGNFASNFMGLYQSGVSDMRGASGRFMDTWRQNTAASGRARIGDTAGDAGDAARRGGAGGPTGREAEEAREYVEVMQEVAALDLQPLTAQQELQLGLMTAIAQEADRIDGLMRRAANGLSDAWGRAGEAVAGVSNALSGYRAEIAAIDLAEKERRLTQEQATRERASAQIQSYGDMASAAKSFFGEQTAAYKALQGVEMAYRALQFANAVKAMALDTTETGSAIGNALARGAAYAASAVAKIFAQLGPFGFPVAAAALGVMAAAGLKAIGGGGSSATPTMPTTNEGRGTVLGDASAESQSLSRSLDLSEKYWNRDLDLSNKMVASLRKIESDIGTVANSIARQLGLSGALGTDGLDLGTSTSRGLLGLTSTTRTSELVGRGLDLNGGTLADLINSGVQGSFYRLVENSKTKSGFLGFGGGTTTWLTEDRNPIDNALGQELGRVLASLREGVLTAASTLGIQGAEATLDALNIALGRIDFEGLSSSEISERLNAIFSAAGDQMASAILPGLAAYQKVGEGMMETLTRLATTFTTVDTTLRSIGMTFGMVGLESLAARDRLVELSGGLEQFTDQASFFAEAFLTEAEQLAPIQAAVTAELQRLGIASDISRTEFAALVRGLDVSTEAGAQMYASLIRLAPALDQVISYQDELAESAANAAREIAEAARAERERAAEAAQAAVDAARNDLSQAYEREASALRDTESRFNSFAASLADFLRSLETDDGIGGVGYGAARSRFNEVASLAALGNEQALGELQGVSEAYLEQSRTYSKDSLAYLRDLSAVKVALQRAENTASRTASNAQMQLAALDASVAGLITLNTSVLSVRDAITRLQSALAGQSSLTGSASGAASQDGLLLPSWAQGWAQSQDFAGNPLNLGLANVTGYRGSFANGAFESWIGMQDDAVRRAARSWYENNDLIPGFATGGSFTVGGSGGTDSQLMQFRATPGEMVDIRRPGANDNAPLIAAIDRLTAENAAQRREIAGMARDMSDMRKVLNNVTNGGDAMRTEAA